MKLTIGITNYNNDIFLGILLEEIKLQCEYDNLFSLVNIVVYDDCSTNIDTLLILEQYSKYFTIIHAEKNSGFPSNGRNYIVDHCKSEYVLFIDADDLIIGSIKKILEELKVEKDIFVSDMRKINSDGNITSSTMIYSWTLFDKGVEEDDIKKLIIHQTGIWSIYNVSFLKKNKIRYSENKRYEDNIFFYTILLSNPRLGLLKEKYYGWRNNYSSFSYGDTMLLSRITMVEHVLLKLEENIENEYAPYILYSIWNQTITNIIRYYPVLSNEEYKTYYKSLKKAFNDHSVCVKKLRKNTNYKYCDIFYKLCRVNFLNSYLLIKSIRGVKTTTSFIKANRRKILKLFVILPLNKKKIFFTSQYGHFSDNSKYLYLNMKKDPQYKDYKFIFAVKNEYTNVSSNPDFIDYTNWIKHFYHHYTSQIIYFDTWYDPKIYKRKKQTWTQLWHGYPNKKLHTDINSYYSTFSNHQILSRYKGIRKWDNVYSVNEKNTEIFTRIFAGVNIIERQYPKVQYLIDNIDNKDLIEKYRIKFKLDPKQKYTLYAPTYRPYNYYIDLKEVSKLVPKEYKLIFHLHPMMKCRIINNETCEFIQISNLEDIQPLLLCTDHLITDCSSLTYDFEQMKKPISYYFNDIENYNRIHGIY